MLRKIFVLLAIVGLLPICGSADNLIIGSQSGDGANATFEKYNDAGGRLLTGNLSIPRSNHTSTGFANGSIFVAGGVNDSTSWQIFNTNGVPLSSGFLNDQRISSSA